MILYPNAKINIGLYVTEKRKDGFHNIETIFYPVPLYDIIEFKESNRFKLEIEGIKLGIECKKNLVYKVYEFFSNMFDIPPVEVYMFKRIPVGAGLGGGSSDAAFFASGLNDYFKLGLSNDEIKKLLLNFGSDCPFFIENTPVLAIGRGEIMQSIEISLSGYHIVIVKPDQSVSTAEAYASIKPSIRSSSLKDVITPVNFEIWRKNITNDFENVVFEKLPVVKNIKKQLYGSGAKFVLMSGSGSAVYALYDDEPGIDMVEFANRYGFAWEGVLN